MLKRALLLSIGMAAASLGASQSSSTVSGRVVDGSSTQTVPWATVTLAGTSSAGQSWRRDVVAASDGSFSILDVPSGWFAISAALDGRIPGGVRPEPGEERTAFKITSVGNFNNLTLRVWQYGAIEGRLDDASGAAVAGSVFMYRINDATGEISNQPRRVDVQSGQFAFDQVRPDVYVVCGVAAPTPTRSFGFVPTCAPSVDPGGATRIAVSAGARVSATITLRTSSRASVEGQLTDGARPVQNATVDIRSTGAEATPLDEFRYVTKSDARGQFRLVNVPVGRYALRAIKPPPFTSFEQDAVAPSPEPLLWNLLPIDVPTSGLSNLVIVLKPGLQVTGQARYEGTDPRPAGALPLAPDAITGMLLIKPQDTDLRIPMIVIKGTQRFQSLSRLVPGRYELGARTGRTSDSLARAITYQGKNVLGRLLTITENLDGIVVTFSDREASLSGTIEGRRADDSPLTALLVFPTDRTEWDNPIPERFTSFSVDTDGQFRVRNVVPGEYFAVAVPLDMLPLSWSKQRAFLDGLTGNAVRVAIAEGREHVVQVPYARLRAVKR